MILANIMAHIMSSANVLVWIKYFNYGLNVYNLVFMLMAYLFYREFNKHNKHK